MTPRWLCVHLCCVNSMLVCVIDARNFELICFLKFALKENVSSVVISFEARLKLELCVLIQMILHGLNLKYILRNILLE
jgi:hypothetical protein